MSRASNSKSNRFISYLQEANRLMQIADVAVELRRVDTVALAGSALCRLGIEDAGHYYLAISKRKESKGTLIDLADHASPLVRAKALVSLGKDYIETSDHSEALKFYAQARALSNTPLLSLKVAQMTAVMHSFEGDHKNAFRTLLASLPVALRSGVHGLNYLNSLAVESLAVGQPNAAAYYLAPCLASPYRIYYPEWSDTAKEIHPTRSRIYVSAPNLDNMTARVAATPMRALMDDLTRWRNKKHDASEPALPSHSQLILANYVRDDVVLSEDESACVRTVAQLIDETHPSFELMKQGIDCLEKLWKGEEKQP